MSKEAKGPSKGRASALASAPIQVTSVASVAGDKCKVCDTNIKTEDEGIECEICEKWFHANCEGMSGAEYEFLKAHYKSLHWYCEDCNKSVATTIKLFNSLKQKVDGLEEKLNKICDGILPDPLAKSIDRRIKDAVDLFNSKVDKIQSDVQGIKEMATA